MLISANGMSPIPWKLSDPKTHSNLVQADRQKSQIVFIFGASATYLPMLLSKTLRQYADCMSARWVFKGVGKA